MSGNSKRDHYLPQFYLNFFLPEVERFFWAYDKQGGDPRPQTPINTGIEGQLYRLEGPRITNPKFIDTTFFQRTESVVKPVIQRLLRSGERLKDTDIRVLADFLALMHIRVPRTQKMVKEVGGVAVTHLLRESSQDTEDIENMLRQCREEGVSDAPFSAEEFRKILERVQEDYHIELTKKPALLLSVLSARTVIQHLLEMHWCLCRAPKDAFFITGDAPLVIFLLDDEGQASFGQGLAESEVEITFPLSPTKCLYLRRRSITKYWPMKRNNVNEFNRRTAYNAERFILSSWQTKEVSRMVSESSITYGRPKVDRKELLERMEAKSTARLDAEKERG